MRERIAFISEHASPLATLGNVDNGGQNVYVTEIARVLAHDDYEVDVFTRRTSADAEEVVALFPHVNVIHVKAGPVSEIPKEQLLAHMDEFTSSMVNYIRKTHAHYSIIHANFFMSALVASRIKRVLHIPYVVTFHALGIIRQIHQKQNDGFPPERVDIERFIVNDADFIVAECPQDRDDLIQHYHARPSKIAMIQCGVNLNEFYPVDKLEARRRLNQSPTEFMLLQLGRMVPRKGVDNVIRAMAKLRHHVKLMIVGGEEEMPAVLATPEVSRLQRIAREADVVERVEFVGRKCREDLKYYYAAADLFVTTPWYEPFGITPLESMACGTPVVGANVGGIKYSVEHGGTGFLVPPNEPDALASVVNHYIEHPSLWESMRQKAISRVNTLFTWDYVGTLMRTLYNNVVQAHVAKRTRNYEVAA